MIAMMSTGSARPAYRATMGFPREDAIAEARRILAVSEPTQYAEGFGTREYQGQSDMRVTVATREYRGYAVASDCLAEALKGFLGVTQ